MTMTPAAQRGGGGGRCCCSTSSRWWLFRLFRLFRQQQRQLYQRQLRTKWAAVLLLVFSIFIVQNVCLYYGWNYVNSGGDDERLTTLPTWDGHPLLDCNEITKLTLGQKLGEGRHKVAYRVVLPNGAIAVAKRCKSHRCVLYERLRLEAEKNMYYRHEKGVDGVVAIYGICYRPYHHHHRASDSTTTWSWWRQRDSHDDQPESSLLSSIRYRPSDWTDLSVGHTVLYEPGQVLMKNWGEMVRHECLAQFFTETDVQDLRHLARSYSAAGICLHDVADIKSPETDNDYPTQYIMTRHGIRHADLDRAYDCTSSSSQNNNDTVLVPLPPGCPATAAALLAANCRILVGGVARRRRGSGGDNDDNPDDCSSASSVHLPLDNNNNERIDIAAARKYCHLDFFGFWLQRWLS